MYLYSPVNLAEGLFKKTKITGESAGRLAIAGFSDPSRQVSSAYTLYITPHLFIVSPSLVSSNRTSPLFRTTFQGTTLAPIRRTSGSTA